MKVLAHAARPLVLLVLTIVILSASPALLAQTSGPAFISSSVTVPIPAAGAGAAAVHLRQQGVVAGAAPLAVNVSQILINGVPANNQEFVYTVGGDGSFGAVCLAVVYPGFDVGRTDSITLMMTVMNAQQQVASAAVTLVNGPAQTVDLEDPLQVAACAEEFVLSQPPVVSIAGGSRTITDTDGAPGETVTLTANATDPDGTIELYEWSVNGEVVEQYAATATLTLLDGANTISVRVRDDTGNEAVDNIVLTVQEPDGIVVNAGEPRVIADSDGQPGEMVELSGSATATIGTIVSYEWYTQNEELLGTGQTITVFLPDGTHTVYLVATSSTGQSGYAGVEITVGEASLRALAELPGLTPNERRLAAKLDEACRAVLVQGGNNGEDQGDSPLAINRRPVQAKIRQPSDEERADFAQRCRGLLASNDTGALVAAMGELLGDDFAVARTQTLLFANMQYASVMDRLIALRGGARGLSLAGLNLVVDGKLVPLAELQSLAKTLLGGGASADEPGSLLSDRWGLWMRGNYSFGSKDRDTLSPRFDADQYALVAGLDYRLTPNSVAGVALAYGNSKIDFDPSDEGGLDTTSWALSVYGSFYAARNFYIDGIVNVADAGYEARRNITYTDGFGLVQADARGDTDGLTVSAGVSGGYDFVIGGLTLSPNFGLFYIDAKIDEFTEYGAGGLNLIYDDQKFKSLTANIGLRATFAWNLPWGVLLPHVRADFVREFEDDVEVFGIRFAADPNATSTPPILVETDNPDTSYWRLAAGMSAQFKAGISGYVEYQRLESFQSISFEDISIGLRFQRSF